MEKALQGAVRFKRWGMHYNRALLRAHQLQLCTNFMDPGLQLYGGDLFLALKAQGDRIFLGLPPPTANRPPPPPVARVPVVSGPTAAERQAARAAQAAQRAARPPSPDMTTYYQGGGGGCFGAASTVVVVEGVERKVVRSMS